MRLIDADALIYEFKARCIGNCDICKYQKGAYCALIDNAPTVAVDNYCLGYQDGLKKGAEMNGVEEG